MKCAVMQPYFFPYLGYWQLLNYVDKYVVFDDVNYINRGWINRNKILMDGKEQYFNIKLSNASQNKHINEIDVINDLSDANNSLKTLYYAYHKAPYFESVIPVIEKILLNREKNLARFLFDQIKEVSDYLGITTDIIMSSDIQKDNSLKGEDKILEICEKLNGSHYVNAIGGRELYNKNTFASKGIDLCFLSMKEIKYPQFSRDVFHPNLSIIDVLMFNSKETIQEYLNMFELI